MARTPTATDSSRSAAGLAPRRPSSRAAARSRAAGGCPARSAPPSGPGGAWRTRRSSLHPTRAAGKISRARRRPKPTKDQKKTTPVAERLASCRLSDPTESYSLRDLASQRRAYPSDCRLASCIEQDHIMGAIEQGAADGVRHLVAGAINDNCPESPAPRGSSLWRYTGIDLADPVYGVLPTCIERYLLGTGRRSDPKPEATRRSPGWRAETSPKSHHGEVSVISVAQLRAALSKLVGRSRRLRLRLTVAVEAAVAAPDARSVADRAVGGGAIFAAT